ncbi:HNH endonuclease signature motif containing protein, partial [Rhodococcoides trifolii]|uniref:HNH endonuclease signature motif containing protein n=1 Tax=Rhodococcoides trifolii TaxID=908250 RepID=UPI00166A9F7D
AAAVRDGVITDEHVSIVSKFFTELSEEVDLETRAHAEAQLGALCRSLRPREFEAAADRLARLIDEDGPEPKDKKDKERTPFVTFGKQGKDGLTPARGLLDSEMLAAAQALDAKYGKPGAKPTDTDDDVAGGNKSNQDGKPGADLELDLDDTDDDVTDVDGTDADTASPTPADPPRWDLRSAGERRHDALKVILRSYLASGRAGKHRGVACAPIVTMTLAQLEAASGMAITATGSSIAVRDALRMASGQHAFLLLLDQHERPLYLGRTRRLGSEDQRLVLYATERGCSFPGCSKPGVWCQVHHTDEWVVDDGMTDIDTLTLACEEHHRIVGPGDNDWATTIAGDDHPYPGRTLWHPPKAWDSSRTGRVNHFHHPQELLYPPKEQR